ncbi:Regulatory protein LEU3 [Fusarium oxysporum f. sp. conglutinans]|nr:Regulatory protein LEU3 [Fusarium oxysporum f. sp. conglutinans]
MQSSGRIDDKSEPSRTDFRADQADKMSSRRKACNECKQQKLRCDLASAQILTESDYCTRCRSLGLDCRIDDGFRRTRKRRQSTDLESEIHSLREQLRATQSNASTSSQHNETNWPVPAPVGTPGSVFNTMNQTDAGLNFTPVRNDSPAASMNFPPATLGSSVTNDADLQCLTTRPGIDPPTQHRASLFPLARPRALGNIILQIEEIDELFNMYIKYNHPYLPLIDEKKSPHEYDERSDLLFWVIMAVAARRQKSQPTLLPRLARNVTDLLWKTLRSMSYSISTIRALCLLCTWPFPTSSSTSDPTFMLVGTMLQMSTQMGLHCAFDAQDFAKVPLNLDVSEHSKWAQTWEACNIVAISVSIGCGLPLFFQMYESPSASQFESSPAESPFYLRLQIERFKLRVSLSLARPVPAGAEGALTRERSTMYHLLNSDLDELEKRFSGSSDIEDWYLMAARLHLQAFYLFDHHAMEGYKNRIVALFSTAYNLVDLSQRLNERPQGLFDYYPFFCYQTYVNAAFVLLKILTNGFFNTIIDAKAGKQLLESSITGLRQMSVVNNDLPARLGDIIGFFCALPDPAVVGGVTIRDLQLKQVRNRLSMSVVYDCLWIWRRHFQTHQLDTDGSNNIQDKFYFNLVLQ